MKKKILSLCALAASVSAFAEGTGSQFAEVTTAMSSLTSNLQSWLSTALPIILAVAGVFLAPWLFRKVIGWIKQMASKG